MLRLDRRSFIAGSAAMAFIVPGAAFAQDTVNAEDLHAPGPLGEKVLGSEDAPVTVVEYASMTCPHCARFHRETYEAFREKYVDSGQAKLIFREFPLNAPAYAAAMIARCAPADRFFDVVDAYFMEQDAWLSSSDLRAATFAIAQPFGFTEASFDACVSNQALFEGIEAVKERGVGFGVQGTPTFFINGKRMGGALSLEQLDAEIEPLL